MFVLATLTIGLFFATCMLIAEPLFLLWPPPLALPFIAGAILAYFIGERGWFEHLSRRGRIIFGLLALPGAIAVPILVILVETHLSMPRIEPPPGATVIQRSVDLGAFNMTFESTSSFDDLKAHFREPRDIHDWRDVPTLDPTDDPEALTQSQLREGIDGLRVLLFQCGGKVCAQVGWSGGDPARPYQVAIAGLLVLIGMIAFGPPSIIAR
jgi:hypothetical protein